jgi:hypothetical protein
MARQIKKQRMHRSTSDLFFARPSLLEGFARLFDFGNTLSEYRTLYSTKRANKLALDADWRAVGQDMWQVFAANPPKRIY